MSSPFHLAFIFNFTPDDWQGPFGSGGRPWDGKFHTEVAQALERACFDYVIIEDKLMVPESYGGSAEAVLKQAMVAPKHDPVPLAVAMGLAAGAGVRGGRDGAVRAGGGGAGGAGGRG
ncbi:hypothetical protein ACWEQJ_34865, partial [Streptomyces cyaneofuscatus]